MSCALKVFKLTPIVETTGDDNWKQSCYIGAVVVCAENENSARYQASVELGVAVERTGSPQKALTCPWGQSDLVQALELSGSEYDVIGKGIIFPSFLRDNQ